MALILNIETSTPVCSVNLAENGKALIIRETNEEKSHASRLTVFIDEILRVEGVGVRDIDAVAVSKGPGSYTGLRIGVSVAKGLCYGTEIPLIAVSTLQALAFQVSMGTQTDLNLNGDEWFCPMIDARRMEVYTAFFDIRNKMTRDISAEIIDESSFIDILEKRKVYFFGNGATKCKDTIRHINAIFLEDVEASSTTMAPISEELFRQKRFEDVAYFEPFYLKDFIATIPRKNILR